MPNRKNIIILIFVMSCHCTSYILSAISVITADISNREVLKDLIQAIIYNNYSDKKRYKLFRQTDTQTIRANK